LALLMGLPLRKQKIAHLLGKLLHCRGHRSDCFALRTNGCGDGIEVLWVAATSCGALTL